TRRTAAAGGVRSSTHHTARALAACGSAGRATPQGLCCPNSATSAWTVAWRACCARSAAGGMAILRLVLFNDQMLHRVAMWLRQRNDPYVIAGWQEWQDSN